jgi:large subunit ribosomal protein L15
MPSKTSRFRGSRTHGRGAKAGRGKGKRGGFGNAGLHKHKFKWMLKYDPDHFGRHGFKRPQGIITQERTINISEVEEKLAGYLMSGSAKQVEGKIQVDLGAVGYDKLLGSGRATLPLTIIVPCASTRAVEKLKKVGGVIVAEEVTAEKKREIKPPAGPPAGAKPAPPPKGGKQGTPATPKPAKAPAPLQPNAVKAGPAPKKQQ